MEIQAALKDFMNLLNAAQENVLWKDLDFDNEDEHRIPTHKLRYFNPLNGHSSSFKHTTRHYVVTIGANGLFTALITSRTANSKSGNEGGLYMYVYVFTTNTNSALTVMWVVHKIIRPTIYTL